MRRVTWFSHGMVRTARSGRRIRPAGRWKRSMIAAAFAVPLVMGPGQALANAQQHASAPPVPGAQAVSGVTTLTPKVIEPKDETKRPYRATATNWPAESAGIAILPKPAAGQRQGTRAAATGTPIWVQASTSAKVAYNGPSKVHVRVLPHAKATALGMPGTVFTVSGDAGGSGDVRVGLNYSSFAEIYGGNYASRLQLVRLPTCALTTPQIAACRKQSPLPTDRDFAGRNIATTVTLGSSGPAVKAGETERSAIAVTSPMVLAANDSGEQDSGTAGTYGATALKPGGSWSAGGSSGSFTYDYPVPVAGSSAPLKPTVGLSYDSGAVDGQTSSTQAQSSWAGDGWSTPDSYIEQTFTSCNESPEGTASPVATPDRCYAGEILTLSLNGSSTSLVYNSTAHTFTAADGNGEKIKHLTGTGNGSGTYNTDYWTVTERDGTTYAFGRNQLPGWSSGKAITNSVDTMPVYSAHSTDPCYSAAGFASSVCTAAYKWHLDYVVDAHSNAMAYYYKQDINRYGQNKGATNASYVRDSYLFHIDHGFRDGGAYGTVPDKVVFGTAARCILTTCDPLSASTAGSQYPDVPFDLMCVTGTCSAYSPSFFSTVRLASITTQQYSTAASTYAAVDTYTLTESEPATGDGTSRTLWLESILHTGNDTTAGGSSSSLSLPRVSFTGKDLQNRVDVANFPGLYRYRIDSVTTEMGEVIGVTYGLPSPCTAASVATATPSTNTRSCYPVYWTPKDYTAPVLDWFEKYAVSQVLESDKTGGATIKATTYDYPGGAAWHYDDNEVVKAKYRTYGQFRGYGTVETRAGDVANDPRTKTVSTYYRGMDGDYLSATSARSVSVADSQGGAHPDTNQLAGRVLETIAYKGDGGPVDHSTVNSYWVSPAIETRVRTGVPDLTANVVQTAETWTRQALTDGGTTSWRYTETDDTYDANTSDSNFGLLTHSYTHTVPAQSAYDQCASSTYALANTSANIVGLIAAQETDSVACSGFTQGTVSSVPAGFNTLGDPTSVSRPNQVESATQTFYDDTTFATTFPQQAAPSVGDVTLTRQAITYSGGAFTWQTTKRETYDAYGRQADTYDGSGNKTTIAYTVNSIGLTSGETVTNAKSQSTSIVADPTRGLTLAASDVNGVVTTTHYDALGRVTAIWLDSRPTSAPANNVYAYALSSTGLSGTTSSSLNDSLGYIASVTLYDSLGRIRQTQTPTPQGGRMVVESFFDSRGLVRKKNNAYWDPSTTPTLALASVQDSQIPNQDVYVYDGLGRVVMDDSQKYSIVKQETTTVYNGDTTTVIPPDGGIVKATVTDPLGRTTALEEYTAAPLLTKPSNTFIGTWYTTGGSYNTVSYGYDGHGNRERTTNAGSTWTSSYNLLGQVTSKSDPDAGTSYMVYGANGKISQVTDARGYIVSYTYDVLGRKTAQYAAAASAQDASNETASWVYDNDNASIASMPYPIGHVTTATSYTGGYAYVTQALGFNILGKSLGETVTIPSGGQGTTLGKAYTFKHTYTTNTGLPYTDVYPVGAGLPAETVVHTYATALDLPTGMADTSYGYVQGTTYDAYGRVNQEQLGMSTNLAYLTNTYDPHTGALTDQLITRSTATPASVDEQAYSYDPAGNLTKQVSTRLGATATAETQCYNYDSLDRLSSAWTATDSCAAAPTPSNSSQVGDLLSTTSAYWTSWTFTPGGQRATQTQHSTTGSTDTTTNYTQNGNDTGQAHTLTAATTIGGSAGSSAYTYDPAGNMVTRNTATTGSEALTWNPAGQLTAVTTSTAGVSYIYDANGDLLIKADPTAKTLYLPGQQITLNTSTSAVSGVRYYALPGGGTAVRTGTGNNYNFEFGDPHGTGGLYLDSAAQTPTWRQFTPYGAPRGTTSTWLDDRGFLNKPADAVTGLTAIGAREYDPDTGSFISLDPLLETGSAGQLNGYSYTANNPIGQSDPTGLCSGECDGSGGGAVPPAAGESAGGALGQAGPPPVPVYTHVSPDVLVQGDTKLLHDIGKDWAAEYKKHYGWAPKGWVITPAEDDSLWLSMCKDYKGLCSQEVVDAVNDAHFNNTDEATEGIMFSACQFTPGGCKNGFGGALIFAGNKSVGFGGEGHTHLASEFAVANYSQGSPFPDISEFSGCNSFVGTTLVLMADGKIIPIDKVKPGDRIKNDLPGSGVGSSGQGNAVAGIYVTFSDRDYVDVTVHTAGGDQTISGTAHHLYWDASSRAWTEAHNLRVGDRLQTEGGKTVPVVATRAYKAHAVTYNLHVETVHTYYVIAGSTPVLVHNGKCTVTFYRTARKGNGESERTQGLDPANHPINEENGDDGSAWLAGNKETAEVFADPEMTTHEDYVTAFEVEHEFFDKADGHPDFYHESYELGGKTVDEMTIPHELIGTFNEHTVSRVPVE